ncbi:MULTISPECIES: YggT family protein [Nocardiopsis]|uniref:YggT family protein n=1 Tax=Nocardiopsis lambiniae TaxID=3075539 RepID=A0ABU2M4I9_9ACTN|nr:MULTISPECIES: YggT family protein [unclassified Nocardiopsis]MDE3720266.1 YggT family protein [Nocardiopsis sp. N85]MDT0327236.1 YggT family protein [Nocardiopsis sp. DSM 44743]
MYPVLFVLIIALQLYVFVLLARVVLEMVQSFSRTWRPTGFLLVIAEIVYTLTDPPLRFLRKFIKPIRLGSIALDLSVLVLFIGLTIVMRLLQGLAVSVA